MHEQCTERKTRSPAQRTRSGFRCRRSAPAGAPGPRAIAAGLAVKAGVTPSVASLNKILERSGVSRILLAGRPVWGGSAIRSSPVQRFGHLSLCGRSQHDLSHIDIRGLSDRKRNGISYGGCRDRRGLHAGFPLCPHRGVGHRGWELCVDVPR